MSLRKCSFCGLEANNEGGIDLFVKSKTGKWGRNNICKKCFNEKYNKKWNKINNNKYVSKKITFRGKTVLIDEKIERKNICYLCEKSYPEELSRRTSLHHIVYDDKNPIAHTVELCSSCHYKIHYLLRGVS